MRCSATSGLRYKLSGGSEELCSRKGQSQVLFLGRIVLPFLLASQNVSLGRDFRSHIGQCSTLKEGSKMKRGNRSHALLEQLSQNSNSGLRAPTV